MAHTTTSRHRRQVGPLTWLAVAGAGLIALLVMPLLSARPAVGTLVQPTFLRSASPVAQARTARDWQPHRWSARTRIGRATGLHRAAYLSTGAGDRLFVLDTEDYSIKTVSPSGRIERVRHVPDDSLVRSYIPLTDMRVASDGTAWFCNPNGRLVGLPDASNEPVVLPAAYRIAPSGDDIIVMRGSTDRYLFTRYSRQGTEIARFGAVLAEQDRHGIALDGEMVADDRGGVLFGPYYGGFVASYEPRGSLRFLRATIDAPPLPPVRHVGGGVLASKPLAEAPRLSDLSAFADSVYVLMSLPGNGQDRESVIDVYDRTAGDYRHSIKLPERCREIEVARDVVYASCGSEIVVWSRSAQVVPAVSKDEARTR